MKKLIGILLIVMVVTLTGCKEKTETITVLTSSGYEPYEMVDTDGNLTGFDIELMEALALEAGITIEWSDVDFNGIIASLTTGKAEIAIAGISPTDERKESVDFSDVYFNKDGGLVNYMLFDTDSPITSLDDLSGLVIGAQLGTIQGELLSSISEQYGFTVDLRNTNTQIVEEIKAGRIDGLVIEKVAAESILELNENLGFFIVVSSLDSLSGNAIAFAKDSEYVAIFNEALQTLKDNGTLDELITKWFN